MCGAGVESAFSADREVFYLGVSATGDSLFTGLLFRMTVDNWVANATDLETDLSLGKHAPEHR